MDANDEFYTPDRAKWCICCERPLHFNTFIMWKIVDGRIVEMFHEECFAKFDPHTAQRMRTQ